MAEVKMSLAEYDALINKLNRYERILKTLFTGYAEGYDLANVEAGMYDHIYISSDIISNNDRQFIKKFIIDNFSDEVREFLNNNKDSFEFSDDYTNYNGRFNLGTIRRITKNDSDNEN